METVMKSKYTIKVNGETREVKMSFGLINMLSTEIGGLDSVPDILLDGALRTVMLDHLLVKRDDEGKPTETLNMFTLEIEQDEAIDLLTWTAEHITDFFLKSVEKTRSLVTEERQAKANSLMPSLDGGKA